MERVRKIFFDPLASSKGRICEILERLPVGSAHPFSPEKLLLCRTKDGIDEIKISHYQETFFFNAVDVFETGEALLRRMAGFKSHLGGLEDFEIMQAPASTFKVPIVSGEITIFAVSERKPSYWDFCFTDRSCNTCCWLARDTFPGITHSGDITNGLDLLDYVKIDKNSPHKQRNLCVHIWLAKDAYLKILYIIPVPLDEATIRTATICCPLVVKRDTDSLICSILPKATTDHNIICDSDRTRSLCFWEVIQRTDFTISALPVTRNVALMSDSLKGETDSSLARLCKSKDHALFTTGIATLPHFLDMENTQIICFERGIHFQLPTATTTQCQSAVVLPCIFGSRFEGPILLATGTVPSNVPFVDEAALWNYYSQLKSAVVIVDERMTDNARNLATNTILPRHCQSSTHQHFQNQIDVTSILESVGIESILDPRAERIVTLGPPIRMRKKNRT
ncbi:hypothetical protein N7507_004396 [Penicillium longicatenatum]|nr:hypothetical protein N7507_004396 [Penicillium longicatenatum]